MPEIALIYLKALLLLSIVSHDVVLDLMLSSILRCRDGCRVFTRVLGYLTEHPKPEGELVKKIFIV